MKNLIVLCALLQWNPTLTCGSCGGGGGGPPPVDRPYETCATAATCHAFANTCVAYGYGSGICSRPCTSDSDCPTPAAIRQDTAPPAVCVRVNGRSEFFCTYAVSSWTSDCLDEIGQAVTRGVVPVSGPTDGGQYVCVPTSVACGDRECGYQESAGTCALDCAYLACNPSTNPTIYEYTGCATNYGGVGCYVLSRQRDAGTPDASTAAPRVPNSGICNDRIAIGCTADSDCVARGPYLGVCVGGFTDVPVCLQACLGTGQNEDCGAFQRCVAGVLDGGFVCVPEKSEL